MRLRKASTRASTQPSQPRGPGNGPSADWGQGSHSKAFQILTTSPWRTTEFRNLGQRVLLPQEPSLEESKASSS